ARNNTRERHDAIDRSAQLLRRNPGLANDVAAAVETFKLRFCVNELGLRRHAACNERAHAPQLRLRNSDHWLHPSPALGNRGAVAEGHWRLNQGQDISLGDRLAKTGKPMLGSDHASTSYALDDAATVGVADDAADECHWLGHCLGPCDYSAYFQDTLHGLRHKELTIW